MRRLTRYRPSPAMVVACISLFVALGGVGYAAATIGSSQIKNNSVRGTDIRNSTITGKDVKNSGLTGSDIKNSSLAGRDVKNNSLTGADLNESSLGAVPRANSAGSADSTSTVGGFRVVKIDPFTLTDNQTRELLHVGPFTFTADCQINDGGNDTAEVLIATSQDNASADGDDTTPDLDTTTPATDRQFSEETDPTGTPFIDAQSDATAVAPDGTLVSNGELYSAVNILNQPGTCAFGGSIEVNR